MRIIAAIDSFKGCATSYELNQAVVEAVEQLGDAHTVVNIPIADGGEGTMAALQAACGGEFKRVETVDPLGRTIEADYLITELDGVPSAVIESAECIGIHWITPSPETIVQANSLGLGRMILDAIEQGMKKIIVSLGGSGTSDGGLGLLSALGATLGHDLNNEAERNPLLTFTQLQLETAIQRLQGIELIILSDVRNPYSGDQGAAKIFGTQKGGTPEILDRLDQRAQQVVALCQQNYGVDLNAHPGTGAAGGLGGALLLLGGSIQAGFPFISRHLQLETRMQKADLVITGEGRMDAQTEQGKVPFGVATLAQTLGIPTVAVCGSRSLDLGEMDTLFTAAFSIQQRPITLEEAMQKKVALAQLSALMPSIVRLFTAGAKR